MAFNLKEECDNSKKREFFYGAKKNKKIKDAYFGLCYLDPNETGRKAGPGRGHEEILYLSAGKIKIINSHEELILEAGQSYFIPDKQKVELSNLTDQRIYFMIAGGHTHHHKH